MEQVENRFKAAEEFDVMPFIVLIFKTRCWYNLRSGVLGLSITGQSFYLRRSPTFSVPEKKHLTTGYCWCWTGFIFLFFSFFFLLLFF